MDHCLKDTDIELDDVDYFLHDYTPLSAASWTASISDCKSTVLRIRIHQRGFINNSGYRHNFTSIDEAKVVVKEIEPALVTAARRRDRQRVLERLGVTVPQDNGILAVDRAGLNASETVTTPTRPTDPTPHEPGDRVLGTGLDAKVSSGSTKPRDLGLQPNDKTGKNPQRSPESPRKPFLTWNVIGKTRIRNDPKTAAGPDEVSNELASVTRHLDRLDARMNLHKFRGQNVLDATANVSMMETGYSAADIYHSTPSISRSRLFGLWKAILDTHERREAFLEQFGTYQAYRMSGENNGDYYTAYNRSVIARQVSEAIIEMDKICSSFVPLSMDHRVLDKLWGAMSTFALVRT